LGPLTYAEIAVLLEGDTSDVEVGELLDDCGGGDIVSSCSRQSGETFEHRLLQYACGSSHEE
jgi:hypothetical protein